MRNKGVSGMDLRITTTNARIGHWTENARLSIQQPRAEMNIETTPAKVEVNKDPLQIIIDQREPFGEAGLKTYSALNAENAQRARQHVMEVIAQKVAEGDQLMRIEKGGKAIADISRNALPGFADWNIGFIPQTPPKIDWQGGTLDIQVEEGKVNIDVKVNPPVIEYTPGKVNYEMLQHNSISIEYVGQLLDKKI